MGSKKLPVLRELNFVASKKPKTVDRELHMKSKTFKKTRLATSLSLVLGVGVVMPASRMTRRNRTHKKPKKKLK
ncbi:hypothetical protein WH43_02065 [Rheinheimera sp. KL1]|nr:hypothetical protein WH43_02065 [Rheinheimera sp. KL1]